MLVPAATAAFLVERLVMPLLQLAFLHVLPLRMQSLSEFGCHVTMSGKVQLLQIHEAAATRCEGQ